MSFKIVVIYFRPDESICDILIVIFHIFEVFLLHSDGFFHFKVTVELHYMACVIVVDDQRIDML